MNLILLHFLMMLLYLIYHLHLILLLSFLLTLFPTYFLKMENHIIFSYLFHETINLLQIFLLLILAFLHAMYLDEHHLYLEYNYEILTISLSLLLILYLNLGNLFLLLLLHYLNII